MLATLSIINVMSVANAGHCSRFENLMVTLDSNWIKWFVFESHLKILCCN